MKTLCFPLALLALLFVQFFSSCSKDDESYTGEIVIWYDEETSNSLVAAGVPTLTYYVDNQVIGSTATNVFWTGVPDCGQNGSITIEKDLGSSESKNFPYRIVTDSGDELWKGELLFEANTCTSQRLNI